MKAIKFFAGAVIFTVAWGVRAGEPPCKPYRLAVRTGTDRAVAEMNLARARKVSIAELRALPRPDLQAVEGEQRLPAEKQLYRVRATLVTQRTGDERDYALVLMDEDKHTLVVEIPAPTCVPPSSPYYARLAEAFRRLDERLRMDEQSLQVGLNIPIEVTGVGFFNLSCLAADSCPPEMAPNLFTLNPILDVKFK